MPELDLMKRAYVLQTAQEALKTLAEELPVDVLDELLEQRERPYALLVELLDAASAAAIAEATPRERAVGRGLRIREQLFQQEGGLASAAELGKFFGPPLTRQGIDLRRKKHQLIAVEGSGGNFRYPIWQVHEGKTLPGLEEVLGILGSADPLTAIVFYLQPDPRLAGARPLDEAREGRSRLVTELARTFGEHGAL